MNNFYNDALPYCNRVDRSTGSFWSLLAFLAGLGGELHLHLPGLGTIPMLDISAYALSPLLLLVYFPKMGKYMRRSIMFGLLWMVGSAIANLIYYETFSFWLNCVTIASSSWTIMTLMFVMLRRDSKLFLWYLAGAGLGAWIALYYFRNGAMEFFATGGSSSMAGVMNSTSLLLDKQVYPKVLRGILLGFLLPICIKRNRFPKPIVIGSAIVAGFFLLFHGGSRSGFGIFCGAASIGAFVAYGHQAFAKLGKNKLVLSIIALLGFLLIFGVYKILATGGYLGESEMGKFEAEFGEESKGVAYTRSNFDQAWACFTESNGVGMGGKLRCHSVMANSLACEGVIGFLFWVYFYFQCLWLVTRRIPYMGMYATFIALMMLLACWDVFGSPFGTRHKFFVLMSFIALLRDNPNYGRDAVIFGLPYNIRKGD